MLNALLTPAISITIQQFAPPESINSFQELMQDHELEVSIYSEQQGTDEPPKKPRMLTSAVGISLSKIYLQELFESRTQKPDFLLQGLCALVEDLGSCSHQVKAMYFLSFSFYSRQDKFITVFLPNVQEKGVYTSLLHGLFTLIDENYSCSANDRLSSLENQICNNTSHMLVRYNLEDGDWQAIDPRAEVSRPSGGH